MISGYDDTIIMIDSQKCILFIIQPNTLLNSRICMNLIPQFLPDNSYYFNTLSILGKLKVK